MAKVAPTRQNGINLRGLSRFPVERYGHTEIGYLPDLPTHSCSPSSDNLRVIVQTIQARAFDAGIEVIAVNPACTSIIGRHKFASRYGISTHQAAAAAIARRAQDFTESPNRRFSAQVAFV